LPVRARRGVALGRERAQARLNRMYAECGYTVKLCQTVVLAALRSDTDHIAPHIIAAMSHGATRASPCRMRCARIVGSAGTVVLVVSRWR